MKHLSIILLAIFSLLSINSVVAGELSCKNLDIHVGGIPKGTAIKLKFKSEDLLKQCTSKALTTSKNLKLSSKIDSIEISLDEKSSTKKAEFEVRDEENTSAISYISISRD